MCSSTTCSDLSWRPSVVESNWKSIAHTWFGWTARSRWESSVRVRRRFLRADRAAQSFLAPQPLDALVVHARPRARWCRGAAAGRPSATPTAGASWRSGAARRAAGSPHRVAGRAGQPAGRTVRAGHPARASLGDPEPLLQMASGPAATVRGQKFPSASSLSMSMSRAWLATSFFSRAFSASSSLSRLASDGLHPAVLGSPPVPGRLGDLQGAQAPRPDRCRRSGSARPQRACGPPAQGCAGDASS